jgi:adenylate cyclase
VKLKISRHAWATLAGAVLSAGVGIFLHTFPAGKGLAHRSYDWLTVARGELPAGEAVLVYLDEKSHHDLKQPYTAVWDRALHARLVQRLAAAGATAIVFDILFTDANPNNPDADEKFADAIKNSTNVILGAEVRSLPGGGVETEAAFELLMEGAANVGSVGLSPDHDLLVRRLPVRRTNDPLPTLSWAAAELAGARTTARQHEEQNARWINYYGPPTFLPWKSFSDALDPALAGDDFFRGKVVFVGGRLKTKFVWERKDEFANPFSAWVSGKLMSDRRTLFMPGVEVQATAFLNLLRGDWLNRLPHRTEGILIAVLGLVFGAWLVRFRPIAATGVAMAGFAIVMVGAYFLFTKGLTWFPWLIVGVQIAAAHAWSVLFNSIQLYVQKRLYEHTLGLYLSPKLVRKFIRDPGFLKSGAEEHVITIFFSDIADFAAASQAMSNDALAKMMNHYFETAVGQCIHKTDGTVVKYIGDSIFAFWNAPEPQPDHALRACEAAIRLRDQTFVDPNGKALRTRVGIHTGLARIGNFGSSERVDYTAFGENVNLASRLEGLNKHLGTSCLITRETKEAVGERLLTRWLGQFQLKGLKDALDVHEILGWAGEAEPTRPWREAFDRALRNYHSRNLEFAAIGFRDTLELRPDDGPSRFYLEKLEELRTQDVPGDWATHTILREK